MPKILELEPHVADLIAAGEVVERPASVVKELVENAIDAGAGIVTIEINDGGMTFIRVTDNGCGIASADAKTAFKRHATSKIHCAEGLESIGTLGFRGEALAAIAAVSRIAMTTREAGANEGVLLSLEAGAVKDFAQAGCPEGTTIVVRDLFFNTPARLKFMKSNRAEGASVAATVLRCALSRPEVSVRFIKDGKSEFHTPGDSRIDSCIYSLFGREFSFGIVYAESSDESISVKGYVSKPEASRGNRSYQYFIVNGRPIQSKMLQAAVEQAYANLHLSGRFPSCALYISTRLGDVDVNVHPTKTEVKFISDRQVFDAVYYAVLGALNTAGAHSREVESARAAPDGAFKKLPVDEYRKSYGSGSGGFSAVSATDNGRAPTGIQTPPLSQQMNVSSIRELPGSGRPSHSFVHEGSTTAYKRGHALEIEASEPAYRIIGEALKTFIVVEHNNSLWLIDKHAAHERIHFNVLKSDNYEPMSQALIVPVICSVGNQDMSLLLENTQFFEDLGFTVESFGEDSVAVRRIPSEIEMDDTEMVISQICEHLKLGDFVDSERLDNIFRVIACKSSIKAGKSSGKHELNALTSKVMSGEITHCPHGRPIAFEITKATLDKGFKRS